MGLWDFGLRGLGLSVWSLELKDFKICGYGGDESFRMLTSSFLFAAKPHRIFGIRSTEAKPRGLKT